MRSIFVEVANFDLQACDLREKGTHLQRFGGIFEISEYRFFYEHFQKIQSGTRTPLSAFFWISSKVFVAPILKHPHENICDDVY